MTRRTWLALASALAASIPATTMTTARGQEETTKILLIGKDRDHAPETHEYMAECALLASCLEQTPGVEAVVSDGWPTDPEAFEGVDSIVLYTANGGDVLLDPAHREQTDRLLADGVGLVALHWSTGAGDQVGPEYLEVLGGWFSTAFAEIPVVDSAIRPADPDHPVCRGWQATPMKDEYYIKLKYADAAKPVVMAEVQGTDYPVGWVFERPDGGRSFGYVCGHFHDCFKIPAFRRSVVNGILWSAGLEVPEAGAPVEVSEADLALPPDPRVPDRDR
jgi:type 1 glutamine amidotransferase